jgi:hypothetical protein
VGPEKRVRGLAWKRTKRNRIEAGLSPMENKPFRKSVNELLELIRQSAPALVSPDASSRQFAAAGLMRCYAGIRGIRVLSANELGPLTVMIAWWPGSVQRSQR